LLTAEGNRVIGLIRDPGHADDVSRAGASPVPCDLEVASVEEIATAIEGADAVVFAAGAGPGSGADRKRRSGGRKRSGLDDRQARRPDQRHRDRERAH
jgi:hypothetical protein